MGEPPHLSVQASNFWRTSAYGSIAPPTPHRSTPSASPTIGRRSCVHPRCIFDARELGLESFGANIPNPVLLAALNAAADGKPATCEGYDLRRHGHRTRQIQRAPDTRRRRLCHCQAGRGRGRAQIHRARSGGYRGTLVGLPAGCDRHELWTHPSAQRNRQRVASASRPTDDGAASRAHTRASFGPKNRTRHTASQILQTMRFAELLEARLQGVLGTIHSLGPRLLYPLSGSSTERMAARRIALVGEAAHVIPPIGAQGLNLGLRDAAALADCAAEAQSLGQDVGGAEVLAAYQHARGGDVAARSAAIDLLNRSLAHRFPAVRFAARRRGARAGQFQHAAPPFDAWRPRCDWDPSAPDAPRCGASKPLTAGPLQGKGLRRPCTTRHLGTMRSLSSRFALSSRVRSACACSPGWCAWRRSTSQATSRQSSGV